MNGSVSGITIPFTAGGTINASTFVKWDSSDYKVVAAGANDAIVGAAGPELADVQNGTGSAVIHARSGDPVNVIPFGRIALVYVGSGGVSRGGKVKSDASGQAVACAATGTTAQNQAGYAMRTAASGDVVEIYVWPAWFIPALS